MFSGCPIQPSVRLSVNTLRRDVFIPPDYSIRGVAYLYTPIALYKSTFYLLIYLLWAGYYMPFCTVTDFLAGALPIGVNFAWRFGHISDRFSPIL